MLRFVVGLRGRVVVAGGCVGRRGRAERIVHRAGVHCFDATLQYKQEQREHGRNQPGPGPSTPIHPPKLGPNIPSRKVNDRSRSRGLESVLAVVIYGHKF
jgi:hypothetical protein